MTETLTQRVFQNTVIQVIGRLISSLLGLWALALMTQYLGPRDFGYFVTIAAFLQIMAVLVDLGLSMMVYQFLAQPGLSENKVVNNLFTLRFFSSLVFILLSSIIILFFPYPKIVKIGVFILSFSFFFHLCFQIFVNYFQKILQTVKIVVSEVFGRILIVGLILMFIKFNFGFFSLLLALVFGGLLNFLLLYIFIQKNITLRFAFDFDFWKEVLKKSWPVALAFIFNLLYFKMDILVLSLYHSPVEVGLYGIPYRILEFLVVFPPLFLGLIQPFLVNSWARQNLAELRKFLQKSFDFLILFTWPIIFGVLILAEKIVVFISGPEFLKAGEILRIFIFAIASIFIGSLFTNTVIAINKQKTMLWIRGLVAILALSGYFLFIPVYSYFAAALIIVLAELTITFSAFFIVRKTTTLKLNYQLTVKSLFSAILMSLVVVIFAKTHLLISILLGVSSYFLFLYLFKAISLETLKEMIRV